MNVNEKGVRGLIKVMDHLQEQGMYVFPAFDDHSPVDLVAMDQSGKTFRLQVKYRERQAKKKAVRYELVAATVINGKRTLIDRALIDGWAVYLKDHNKVVYVPVADMTGSSKILTGEEYGSVAEWPIALLC